MARPYAPAQPAPSEDPLFARIYHLPYRQRRGEFSRRVVTGYPRFLYRYGSLNADNIDRARDLIVRSELWLSSPTDFNDPFDTAAHVVFDGTINEMRAWLMKREAAVVGLDPAEKARRREAMLANPTQLAATVPATFRKHLDAAGIACFTPDPRNLLMWSHYGASHKGIAYQFEPTQALDTFTYAVPVNYSEEYPVVDWLRDPQSGLRSTMLRKHPGWAYERESRIFQPNGGRSYLPFDPSGLTGIILGCKASAETETALQRLLEERTAAGRPAVKLYRAQMHPQAYKVTLSAMLIASLSQHG